MKNRSPTTAGTLARLAPFLLTGLALPLLAPSCGDFKEGTKTFAKGSLIIPMDVCYQCTRQSGDLDTSTANCTRVGWTSTPSSNQCPQALSQGDVIRAYGLVYELIRNDVAVYWVIDQGKAALDGYDMAIQFGAGFPVVKYDWASGQPGTTSPTSASVIRYMGGPFVIDGSDQAKAIAVMKANQSAFSTVNVHVSNLAFQAYAKKTMAGGWSAGGAVAPKLALLDIGSGEISARGTQTECTGPTDTTHSCLGSYCIGTVKNSEQVIQGYLAKAGIDSPGAGGTSAAGAHGRIYDRLLLEDFQPSVAGDWTTTSFFRNGYQILWIPHWTAPGSCRAAPYNTAGDIRPCACLTSRATDVEVGNVLKAIGAFSAKGGDVFAECAGLGSLEGAVSNGDTLPAFPIGYAAGDLTSRLQTTAGMRINDPALDAGVIPGNFPNPLLQIGDFPFKAVSGAIDEYRPITAGGGAYLSGVDRLITALSPNGAWDYFTLRSGPGAPGRGTAVYLAGHSYSGNQGTFQVAGSRLVLNTLFNLGAGCTASGVACDTGSPGACSKGVLTCGSGGAQVCTPAPGTPVPVAACAGVTAPVVGGATCEICNGIDDDCDGLVDEGLELDCYSGPPGTRGVGVCRAGLKTCQVNADGTYGYSACQGEVLPSPEDCNNLDDDCDGEVDDLSPGVPLSGTCYSGPQGTQGVGACRAGTYTCSGGVWGSCLGEVLPRTDPCHSPEYNPNVGADLDCDGAIDLCNEQCTPNTETRDCFEGPASALTVAPSLCRRGLQRCNAQGQWGATCEGQVLPAKEICRNGADENCNGLADDVPPLCMSCRFKPDPADPTKPDTVVSPGEPAPATTEALDCWTGPALVPQLDQDGNPVLSGGNPVLIPTVFASASPASVCVRGFQFCQATGLFGACERQTLPGPELCNGKDDNCNGRVDEGAECGAGFACVNGVCVNDTCSAELPCRAGYDCVPCPAGDQRCAGSHCILASCCRDPECTSSVVCPAGTVCYNGSGTAANGNDPCQNPCDPAAIRCGTGSACAGGYCTGGACYAVGCLDGQLCQNGACVADPCAGKACPSGTFCRAGDCVQACAIVTCGPAERCDQDGFCVADPCAGKSCGPTESCVNGACHADPCVGTACGAGQRCVAGVCSDDPCAGVTCPVGQCRDGQCYATHLTSAAGAPDDGGSGGCGCGGGAGSPLALLGVLLALPLARRRRRAGRGGAALPPLLLAMAALGLAATGCKESAAPFDPASCVDPAVSCDTEARCVDPFLDPSHCGGCNQPCQAGFRCVDAACVPASAVAPFLAAVSPPSAFVEGTTPKVLTLTGQRLVDRTTMRATGPGGTFTVPTQVVGGGLQAALDLTTAAPGVWTLRVVSPDGVISNQRTFGVTIAKALLSRVTPAAVAAGAQVTLRLEGQHLMVASHCLVSGVGLAEREVPATLRSVVVGSGAQDVLDCDLDLTGFSPGGYSVRVRNSETLVSDPLGFQVVTSSPSISDVAPNSAGPGTTPLVLVFGTGFDGSSTVWLKGPGFAVAQRTEPLSATQLRVPALDLTKCPTAPCALSSAIAPQQYTLEVRNSGAGGAVIPSTEVVPFVIESSGRTYARISPTSAFQGDQPVVRLLGTNLTGGVLEYAPPGGTFQPALAQQTAADGSYVEGRLDLVGTAPDYAPAGSWSIRLAFTAGATTTYSPSFTLRVDSNQAVILTTPSPAGGQAGQSVRVKLTAVNLRPPIAGVRVRFYDPTPATLPGFTRDLTPELPTQDAVTGIWTVFVTLDLAGRDTKVHALRLVNPNGAAPSAPYNFTVSPGLPRVDTVACTSLKPAGPCTDATHAQQKGIIPIRITGANFAMPDLAGNNGSQVRVSSAAVAVTDFLIPPAAVTVVSAGEITVQLDTTLAVLQVVNNQQVDTAYALEVWNPGAGLQSAPFANAFILTP